jgi:hypothetical protein
MPRSSAGFVLHGLPAVNTSLVNNNVVRAITDAEHYLPPAAHERVNSCLHESHHSLVFLGTEGGVGRALQ